MKRLAFALAVLTLSAAPAAAAPDKGLAPAVTRAPSAAPAPSATSATSSQPACDPSAGTACAPTVSRGGSAQQYRAALQAGRPGEDVELNSGVTKVMGDLMAAGRCGDAVSLARREGRSELATRAQQLCK